MKELIARAALLGLTVHAIHMPDGELGYYAEEECRIYFNIRATPAERLAIIAHEIAHAYYGHDCDSDANERQADAYAAMLLVQPAWYADLERINADADWIADEMGLTADVIDDYREHCLRRMGSVTFTRPRMGLGQWLHRSSL